MQISSGEKNKMKQVIKIKTIKIKSIINDITAAKNSTESLIWNNKQNLKKINENLEILARQFPN